MNKKLFIKNINELVKDFYYELYCEYKTDDIESEKLSALIFNAIFISCQLLDDIESIKSLAKELINNNKYSETIDFHNNPDLFLPQFVSKYSKLSHDEIMERLKHGYAVHFTTSNIGKMIEHSKVLSCENRIFSQQTEDLIHKTLEDNYTKDWRKSLTLGFGTGKGISVSTQTVGYWMYHTPESLSFLFGGHVYTRDKKLAFEHIRRSISELDLDIQRKLINELNIIWDTYIGYDLNPCAVLIDRDGIKYEKVTYWSYNPPIEEEIRPYRNSLMDIVSNEDSRIHKDINIEFLEFLAVPSIVSLEEYKKNNNIKR